MVAITAAGAGSGLDIEKIIETLTAAERAPADSRLATREIEIQADISAYGSLKGSLKDFQKALSGLTTVQSLAARTATSSSPETFTATASNGAAVGATAIQVLQLATNHKLVSNKSFATAATAVGAGTLSIAMGSKSFNVQIVGGQNNTLTGIRDAINAATDNPGVTASILTVSDGGTGTVSKLVLTADETGAANSLAVTVTGDSDGNDTDNNGLSSFLNANMTQKSAAQDAQLQIDGEYTVNSSTNVFKDAIQGVTITAVKANPGVDHTLTVGLDKTAISTQLQTFVDEFNLLSETLNYLTDYDPETKEAGLLTGESSARTIETQIRRTLSGAVEGLSGNFSTLASLGITTQKDGTLKLDSTKLNDALASNFDDVAQLLAGDKGVFKTLNSKLSDFLRSDGIIATRNTTFLSQLKDIDEQRAKLNLRMTSYEERIRLQYSNLDILVGQLKSTGDFVSQQLSALQAGMNSKK